MLRTALQDLTGLRTDAHILLTILLASTVSLASRYHALPRHALPAHCLFLCIHIILSQSNFILVHGNTSSVNNLSSLQSFHLFCILSFRISSLLSPHLKHALTHNYSPQALPTPRLRLQELQETRSIQCCKYTLSRHSPFPLLPPLQHVPS